MFVMCCRFYLFPVFETLVQPMRPEVFLRCITLSDGLQQVAASVTDGLWLRFGSRTGCYPARRWQTRTRTFERWWRRTGGRRWRRWWRWTPACRHRWWRRDGGHRWGRRGSRWSGRGDERRGRRGGVKARGRWGNPKAKRWRRGRRCRGRRETWAGVVWGRGIGGSWGRVAWTQHAATLLGGCSIVTIPVSDGEEVGGIKENINGIMEPSLPSINLQFVCSCF